VAEKQQSRPQTDELATLKMLKNWLTSIDCQMRNQNQQILLLCNNCAAHTASVRLTNIKVVILPSNITSFIQPMDQGIIANLKKHYRSLVL